jgi:hypothetical protein
MKPRRWLLILVGLFVFIAGAGARVQTAFGSVSVLLGDTTVQSAAGGGTNTSEAFGYVATTSGTATDAEVYLTSASGARIGLYADNSGKPGALLDQGSVATNSSGWTDVSLSRQVKISANTRYWLAIAANGGTAIAYRDSGSSGNRYDYSGNGLANPYSISGHRRSSNPASVYLNGTVGSIPATATAAAFTFSPANPATGQAVTFDGSTSTCAATPCSYHYIDTANNADLGDQQDSTFTFQHMGTKYVQLTVTDAAGVGSTVEHNVVVGSSPANPVPPSSTAAPAISGIPQVGDLLTATPGSWAGSTPISYTYAWSDGTTGQTDTLGAADVGHNVNVTVTATNSAGSAQATSASVGPVQTVSQPVAPSNTSVPAISGTPQQGDTLTAATGSWSGDTPMTFSYQWQQDGSTNIASATGQSYTAQASDVGHTLDVVVTATNDAGHASAASKGAGPVTATASDGTASCTQHVTTSSFASTFSSAGAGAVLCLAPGNYGTFTGSAKAAPGVTITADPSTGGTQTNVIFGHVSDTNASWITMDTATVGGASINSPANNLTFRNIYWSSFVDFENLQNANVLFDHDQFTWGGKCDTGSDNGLLEDHYGASGLSGVTVQYSAFANSDCDGVHTGVALNVVSNTFTNLCDQNTNHTDNIQFQGALGGRIAANYIHESLSCTTQGITSYDGGTTGVLIEDNVVDIGRPWGIEYYADVNSIIRHNTVVYRGSGCEYGDACGYISLDCKPSEYSCPNQAGYGTQVYDNLATVVTGDGATAGRNDHNMSAQTVTYQGGSNPPPNGGFPAFSGYLLAPGSTGKGAADDGSDLGITG